MQLLTIKENFKKQTLTKCISEKNVVIHNIQTRKALINIDS